MAYTAPTTRSTGNLITAAQWNTDLVDNISFLANAPSCHVFHSTTQNMVSNTPLTVAFNSERHDSTGTMHDNVTNNSRITVPVAGVYVATFSGVVEADNDYNFLYAYIQVNGATILAGTTIGTLTDAGIAPWLNVTTPPYKLAANDYLQVVVAQKNTSAGAHNLASLTNHSPEFAVQWVALG